MEERVEIGCYTQMSEMLGISSVEEYIDNSIKRGWKAIGITDLNNTQNFIKAQEYLKKIDNQELKIIYGIKTTFVKKENDEENDIIILVQNQKGLNNLYTLLSKALMQEENRQPKLYKQWLDEYRSGLLYGTFGTNGELYKNIDNEEIAKYYDFIGIEPLYNTKIEVPSNTRKRKRIDITEKLKNTNKKLIEIGKKNNILVMATSNPLFIDKKDQICSEILRYSQGMINCEYNNEKYLHTTEEMLEKFNYLEQKQAEEIVVTNTNKLAELCEKIDILKNKAQYPQIENSKQIITEKCYKKAKQIYGENLPKEIEERLKLELNSIIENNFEYIYLLANDVVEKSHELGYLVGTRGSVGNSFVAYLLGIVEYNPINYKLPFEMFAGKDFDRQPDIDLNVSNEIQEEIHKYIIEKNGKSKTIYAGTVGTTAYKTVNGWVEKYSEDLEIFMDKSEKERIIDKLCGIKRTNGVHPGGLIMLPQNKEITEICPVQKYKDGIKTYIDYHSIDANFNLYKFDILGHSTPTFLYKLKRATNIDPQDIDLNDRQTLEIFINPEAKISTIGIPEFSTKFMRNLLKTAKPKNINDLISINGLSHGTGTWIWNAEKLICNKYISVDKVISNRAEMMNYLIEKGIKRKTAFDIVEFIRKGKASQDTYTEKWNEYKKIMIQHNIPEWYIKSAEMIKYLFPKAHTIGYTIDAFRIAWYKVHFPEAFYKTYFELKGNIDIHQYNSKKQIERKIRQLEEENPENYDEIDNLKLLLEMYNRNIIKSKTRQPDDYDLINSKAISEYCRQIKHKFNTEELAVLVYRNKQMDIEEKIAKYEDLINNYPDMEVIERINCKHYDSVKTMIKNEIKRLRMTKNKFLIPEDKIFYSYDMYYTSTREWTKEREILENIQTNYEDIDKEIQDYIKEYNDCLAYRIRKIYIKNIKSNITAEYQVIDNKKIMTNIYTQEDSFLDIDNIFINIPTPFKKGDLLVTWDNTIYREGLPANNEDIFVLDWLCTWREDLKEHLKQGNYDSSDMIGYGYYMYEGSSEFTRDHKWNYDSFEYYEGQLKGINRTLKAISSLMKNKIELDLFQQACNSFKIEHTNSFMDYYTDEGLSLAGFSKEDIQASKKSQTKAKTEEEKRNYLKYEAYGFENIDKENIKQIEITSSYQIYVLLNNGELHEAEKKISDNIDKLYVLNNNHIYKITKDNKIIPMQEIYSWNDWDDTDKYLYNDNNSYKKIVTNKTHIVALTNDGQIRTVHTKNFEGGIIPDNFYNVEDIIIKEDEDTRNAVHI